LAAVRQNDAVKLEQIASPDQGLDQSGDNKVGFASKDS
jgi:hypothetical protein